MANTYYLIGSSTVASGGTPSITFSSIPNTYTDFKLVASLRTDGTFGNPWYDSYVTVNSTDLSWIDFIGLGSSTASSRNGANSFVTLAVASSGATSATYGNFEIYIPNYAGSRYKSAFMEGGSENNATGAGMGVSAGLYSSTSAITSITITPYNSPTVKFAQFSSVYLYGIKSS